jgi:hypothetical protein
MTEVVRIGRQTLQAFDVPCSRRTRPRWRHARWR